MSPHPFSAHLRRKLRLESEDIKHNYMQGNRAQHTGQRERAGEGGVGIMIGTIRDL